MSETSGEGWWIASDGRWYPPHLHPDYQQSTTPLSDSMGEAASSPEIPGMNRSASPPELPRRGRFGTKMWLTVSAAVLLLFVGIGTGLILGTDGGTSLAASHETVDGTVPPATSPSTVPTTITSTPESTTIPSTVPPANSGPTAQIPTPPAPPTSGPLITPTIEQDVVDSTWNIFLAGFDGDGTAILKELSTPAVNSVMMGALACGCSPWPPDHSSVSYSAPPQTTYPLSFWAEFQGQDYDGRAMTEEVVFTQASAASPWLVADVGVFYDGTQILGSNTNDNSPTPALGQPVSTLANDLAQYYQKVDSTGNTALPPSITENHYIDTAISDNNYALDKQNGWVEKWTHTVAAISPAFAVQGDPYAALACFTMNFTDVTSSANGAPIVQPPNQTLFPPILPAGSYSSITSSGTADLCFVDNGNGSATLISNYGGANKITGVRG